MSQAFWNAFWVFVGIVCGSVIQYLFHWLTAYKQRKAARRLMQIEATINREEMRGLERQITLMREAVAAREPDAAPGFIDMSGFNYTLSAPLINSGHFHDILGHDGVAAYFRFANQLNSQNAINLGAMYQQELTGGTALSFVRWLSEIKLAEWNRYLTVVEGKLNGSANE